LTKKEKWPYRYEAARLLVLFPVKIADTHWVLVLLWPRLKYVQLCDTYFSRIDKEHELIVANLAQWAADEARAQEVKDASGVAAFTAWTPDADAGWPATAREEAAASYRGMGIPQALARQGATNDCGVWVLALMDAAMLGRQVVTHGSPRPAPQLNVRARDILAWRRHIAVSILTQRVRDDLLTRRSDEERAADKD
jgi:Ulp1 family protease